MISDELKGMSVDDVAAARPQASILDLLGIEISATRMKCALLGAEGGQERQPRRSRRLGARRGRAAGDPDLSAGAL